MNIDPVRLFEGARAGRRADLGRAITLLESRRAADRPAALEIVERSLLHAQDSVRVAITGAPGVGKSTLIEALGLHLVQRGHRVAVLAIDPSAPGGGSILGDKTRMPQLAAHPGALIRPSPSRGQAGGVARHTRDVIALCEACGFDTIIVETVGVGQAGVAVAEMVDVVVVLLLAGGGDDLQGIKRGLLEHADLWAVTKADGDNVERSREAALSYRGSARLLPARPGGWIREVTTCSATTGAGIGELWGAVERHQTAAEASGARATTRERQRLAWMWHELREHVLDTLEADAEVHARADALQADVQAGTLTPHRAAAELMAVLWGRGAHHR